MDRQVIELRRKTILLSHLPEVKKRERRKRPIAESLKSVEGERKNQSIMG